MQNDDYVFLTLSCEKAEIELPARLSDGNSKVNVQANGILWTKPLPGGKQVISYEAWLRLQRHPASLELLDAYQAEMRSIAAEKPSDEISPGWHKGGRALFRKRSLPSLSLLCLSRVRKPCGFSCARP